MVNGRHSDHEALAFDLKGRGLAFEEIARLMGCDTQTVKTYVQRARVKNKREEHMAEALRLSGRLE